MGMDVIEELGEASSQGEQSDESSDDQKGRTKTDHNQKVQVQKPKNVRFTKPAPLEVLNHVQFNNTLETPRSTIKGVLQVPMQTELTFSRENLNKVEGQLKRAFVEFYQKLRLLKNFRQENMFD